MLQNYVSLLFVVLLCGVPELNSFLLYHKYNYLMNNYANQMNSFNKKVYKNADYAVHGNGYGEKPILAEYDFIIVGSGPSGAVLANRLSENEKWKILLIEAGNRENLFSEIPLFAAYLQSTDYNWGHIAEPQANSCWGMIDQKCAYPSGKALGGGSVINYMIYIRGNKLDYDKWAAAGNTGWSYKEVLPYFLKSERASLKGMENSPYHNKYGSLDVAYPPFRTPLAKSFVKAYQQLGYPKNDYNAESQSGVSFVQSTTRNGRRISAAAAFLDPILSRPNLDIMLNTRATKVLIDPYTKTAYGIEYVKNKKRYTVLAKKEVILSAGVFHSPQLLMLSGIGPYNHLNEINVPVLKDLPVGQTMYDHVTFHGLIFTTNTTEFAVNTERLVNIPTIKQYAHGTGVLTLIGAVEAVAFIKTNNSDSPPSLPDVEVIFTSGCAGSDQGSGLKTGMRLRDEIYNPVFKVLENPQIDTFATNLMLFHPKSKGYLKLKDNNPFHWPKFYTNFFEDDRDLETLLQAIKEVIKMLDTPAMKKYGTRIHDIPLPNCAYLYFGTDDYWRCALKTLSGSLHHQIGTCKMGPESDPTAVVSPELKVHGINNLRVVDNSVIPSTTSGHTAAPAFMIGEKAADMIKFYWSWHE